MSVQLALAIKSKTSASVLVGESFICESSSIDALAAGSYSMGAAEGGGTTENYSANIKLLTANIKSLT
eukprot:742850-Amphidinium_carterae.1